MSLSVRSGAAGRREWGVGTGLVPSGVWAGLVAPGGAVSDTSASPGPQRPLAEGPRLHLLPGRNRCSSEGNDSANKVPKLVTDMFMLITDYV